MKKLILITILFVIIKTSPAQTFNCFIANDSLAASNEYEFDVYIQSTGPDFLFRSFQGCFTFDSLFIPAGAMITASYDTGSTQLLNYASGTITYSGTAPGFMTAVNTGPSCATGTLISSVPIRVGTYRMIITNGLNFACMPSNPNMVLPGETAAGLALRTAITKWDSINCAVQTNTNITTNGEFTQSGPHSLYDLVNNMAPVFTGSPVSGTICEYSSVNMSVQVSTIVGVSPPMYQWFENGMPIGDSSTAHGIYSGTNTPTLTIDSASSSLNGNAYYCMVVQCSVGTSDSAILYVNNAPVVNLGPADTVLPAPILIHLDAGMGFLSYSWSTGETTQAIDVIVPGTYGVTIVDSNGCTAADSIDIIVSSINDPEEKSFLLFPNPASDVITISELKIPVQSIHAINLIGEITVLNFERNTSKLLVDVAQLPSGLYVLEMQTSGGLIQRKLMVR